MTSIIKNSISDKILTIRNKQVILDKDLAEMYGVETKYLTRQVRRNVDRFPKDFLLIITPEELRILKCQFGTSRWGGNRKSPLAFTEHGILMLSSVLRSKRAIQVNIEIMRTFVKLREMALSQKQLSDKINSLEQKYDHQFKIVFDALRKLLDPPKEKNKPIGFHAKTGGKK